MLEVCYCTERNKKNISHQFLFKKPIKLLFFEVKNMAFIQKRQPVICYYYLLFLLYFESNVLLPKTQVIHDYIFRAQFFFKLISISNATNQLQLTFKYLIQLRFSNGVHKLAMSVGNNQMINEIIKKSQSSS